MKSNAINQILEGLVGTLTAGITNYPQSLTYWLRAMKESINFNGRFVEDDHVLGIAAGVDGTTNGTAIKASATYVYGMLATNIDTAVNVAFIANVATFNPATTALDFHGVVYLPTATSTAPTATGLVWFPYEYMDTGVYGFGVNESDYGTAASASTVNIWTPYRNE